MTSGSTPTKPYETSRIATGRPSSSATSSAASRQAVAPSLRPAALPAVTLPCGRNGVFSVASFSSEVSAGAPRRRWPGPSRPPASRVATVTRSGCSLPSAYALAVFCCEASAEPVGALLGDAGQPVVQVLRGRAHDQRGRVDQLLGEDARVRVDALAHRVAAHVLDAAGDGDVVGAHGDAAGDAWSPRSSRRRTCGRWRSRARSWAGRPAARRCGRWSGPGRRSGWWRRWPPRRPAPAAAAGCGAAARGCSG